jgi:organic hydroperoxide reductase OsmC/OhrA
MDKLHHYELTLRWTGNRGGGTASYRAYSRDHELGAKGKGATIEGSSDPAFRGDAARYNPEELLVGAAAACHMLWFLHLSAAAGVVVTGYEDAPIAVMVEHPDGAGEFTRIELRPRVTVAEAFVGTDLGPIHATAHAKCFVARSLRCEVVVTLP